MTLVPMARLVADARAAGRGIGAFNVITLEHAEGIIAGAEQAALPVILQVSENTADYHGGLAPIGRATLEIAATPPSTWSCTSTTRRGPSSCDPPSTSGSDP